MLLDDIFWLTLAIIFATGIIGALVRTRQRDRCLKMFDDQTVTAMRTDGRIVWGDLRVFHTGVELGFRHPHTAPGAPDKNSILIDDVSTIAAFCRYVGSLTPDELETRRRQVRKRFRPGPLRRAMRSVRNFVNTVRDAFHQAISAFVGQVSKGSKTLGTQQGQVSDVGKELIGAAGLAYEPLLERHIGRPVVVELASPVDESVELAGYLAEYSADYLALFNVEHTVESHEEVAVDAAIDGISRTGDTLCNQRDTPAIISVSDDDDAPTGVVLLRGATMKLPSTVQRLSVGRVPRIDVVCSRKVARVAHAGA